MPRYLFLFKADKVGSLGLLTDPIRSKALLQEAIGHLNGTVVSFDPVMGRYDLVVSAELPADASAVALSHVMNAGGLYPEVLQA